MSPATTPKRPDARAVRSKAAMRAALLSLLAQMPLSAITGAIVADTAGVGYSTFFRHYADVHALLIDTVGVITDDLALPMLQGLISQDSHGAALKLVGAVDERRSEIAALLAGAGSALKGELAQQVVHRLSALPDLSPQWLPQKLAIRIAVAASVEIFEWWLLEAPHTNVEDIAGMLEKLVIAPILFTRGE